MRNLLVILLVLMIVGVFPIWPHSASWGFYPGGGLSFVLLLAIIFIFANPKSLN